MIAVIGLGNPGKQYEKSRHNVGFFVIDLIRQKLGCNYSKSKNYEYFDYTIDGQSKFGTNKIKFIRPLTYMNLSGDVFVHLYHDKIDELIVVCDNIDLEMFKLRFKFSGGSAGHNGLKSIIANYRKSNDFYRLYIGCGRKAGVDVKDLVLEPMNADEQDKMKLTCQKACDVILEFLKDGDAEKAKQLCSKI